MDPTPEIEFSSWMDVLKKYCPREELDKMMKETELDLESLYTERLKSTKAEHTRQNIRKMLTENYQRS